MDKSVTSKQEKQHQHGKSAEKQLLQKKKKTAGKQNHDMMGHDEDRQMEDESATICRLCNREQPLYFYQQEDVIKRLPERSLTKLTLKMKQDLLDKKLNYLKYLRVSAKFCDPCQCARRKVHTYC